MRISGWRSVDETFEFLFAIAEFTEDILIGLLQRVMEFDARWHGNLALQALEHVGTA